MGQLFNTLGRKSAKIWSVIGKKNQPSTPCDSEENSTLALKNDQIQHVYIENHENGLHVFGSKENVANLGIKKITHPSPI